MLLPVTVTDFLRYADDRYDGPYRGVMPGARSTCLLGVPAALLIVDHLWLGFGHFNLG